MLYVIFRYIRFMNKFSCYDATLKKVIVVEEMNAKKIFNKRLQMASVDTK